MCNEQGAIPTRFSHTEAAEFTEDKNLNRVPIASHKGTKLTKLRTEGTSTESVERRKEQHQVLPLLRVPVRKA